MITVFLAALLTLGTTPERGLPDPDAGTTAARARPRPDADPELLRDLDLLEKLDLLQNLELFDEGR